MKRRVDELFEGLPKHLSVEQLADVLGVTRNTAYRYLKGGQIPAYRVGTSWVILRDEVKDLLVRSRVGPDE
ncbi:helix-turn-helix domain-containing protein [Cellulosimicrobium composti]|uniref:helix-turn-helix domain-containing protein n=1 Tax=Cellulosimicrobium TaxID=157920 RepID=UPI0018ACA9A5|nr:helix-turn-helix domain-containing protein [Cellulosimicrobium composti]